jgi:hypothetical protein
LDSDALREAVRNKVISGTLPAEPALNVWASMGGGRVCAACEQPIEAHDTQIELEFPRNRGVVLHRPCYAVWLEVCDHR